MVMAYAVGQIWAATFRPHRTLGPVTGGRFEDKGPTNHGAR